MKYKKIIFVFLVFFLMIGITGCFSAQKEKHNELHEIKTISSIEKKDAPVDTASLFVPEPIQMSKRRYIPTEIFFEDFDGDKIDETFWNRMYREKNYNNELQVYVPKNAFVHDGNLVLLADNEGGKYISGLVDTKGKIEFQYGTVEVRLKYPEGKSFFPAVWMLPVDDTSFPEIDIFEVVGHDPSNIYSVYHYYKNEQKKIFTATSIENHLDFHTYKFEWMPEEMKWYIDEDEVFSTKKEIPDEPMYLIINFAIGGIWPGDPNANTVFPSSVLVDYIKITPYKVMENEEVTK